MIIGNACLLFVNGADNYTLFMGMRVLGTMIIPMITFLMIEGYYNTSNRKMYFVRLAAFGFAAESAFLYYNNMVMDKVDAAIQANIKSMVAAGQEVIQFNADGFTYEQALVDLGKNLGTAAQNYYTTLYDSCNIVMFSCGLMTLAAAYLMICSIGILRKKYAKENRTTFAILTILTILGFVVITMFSEASAEILVYSLIFYFFREKKTPRTVVSFMAVLVMLPFTNMIYIVGCLLGSLLVMLYKEDSVSEKQAKAETKAAPVSEVDDFKARTGLKKKNTDTKAKKSKKNSERYVKIPGKLNRWVAIAIYAVYPLQYIVFCMINKFLL